MMCRPGGRRLHSPAGGRDLVGAWLEAPSLSCPTVGLCVPALLTATERTGMTTLTSGSIGCHRRCRHPRGGACRRGLRGFGPFEKVGVEGTGS